MSTSTILNVTEIEPRLKHPTIFRYFDDLQPGESFTIENDHDPKPLYYELLAERGDIFSWEYLQQGPEVFMVCITKNPEAQKDIHLVVSELAPRLKHPTVFEYFDRLQPGESFTIENDHDPKPLYYEILAERGDIFSWEYLEKGPDVFIVNITKKPEVRKEEIRLVVSELAPRLKHPTVFEYFDRLEAGESFTIENDHDPKPLYYELLAERGDIFTWEYVQQGPDVFEVKISKNDEGGKNSDREKDLKKAQLIKEKGVQFQCSNTGKDTAAAVENPQASVSAGFDYDKWELDFLADYIVNTHHRYIKETAEQLNELSLKVAEHHSHSHPELNRLATVTYYFLQDLADHIMREEEVLFPVIKQMVAKTKNPDLNAGYDIGTLAQPLHILEKEHQLAQHDLHFFRLLTNDYTVDENACSSHRFLFTKMQEFENDLQLHFHLENDILFPKALELDTALAAKQQ